MFLFLSVRTSLEREIMFDMRSTIIVSVSIYCDVMAAYFLCLAGTAIFGVREGLTSTAFGLWLIAGSLIILAAGLIAIGIGILNFNQLCWRLLFFSLAMSVSSMASFILAFLFFLWTGISVRIPYFQSIQTNSSGWFYFLAFFLSEIIVLYFLSKEEVVSCFDISGRWVLPD